LGENPRDKIAEVTETNPRTFDELRLFICYTQSCLIFVNI